MGLNPRFMTLPFVYSVIEQEYMFELSHMSPVDLSKASQNLLDGILSKYRRRRLTYRDEANIRFYFASMGTLEGLAEWAEAIDPAGTQR